MTKVNIESERKFLVKAEDILFLNKQSGMEIQQGYLYSHAGWEIRVRTIVLPPTMTTWKESPFTLTTKGPRSGLSRREQNIDISQQEAKDLMESAFARIHKTRYLVNFQNYEWEVDIFQGDLLGFVTAECEADEEVLPFLPLPSWLSKEATGEDDTYGNFSLAVMLTKPSHVYENFITHARMDTYGMEV